MQLVVQGFSLFKEKLEVSEDLAAFLTHYSHILNLSLAGNQQADVQYKKIYDKKSGLKKLTREGRKALALYEE